jgi:hypothetical protein
MAKPNSVTINTDSPKKLNAFGSVSLTPINGASIIVLARPKALVMRVLLQQ